MNKIDRAKALLEEAGYRVSPPRAPQVIHLLRADFHGGLIAAYPDHRGAACGAVRKETVTTDRADVTCKKCLCSFYFKHVLEGSK